MVDNEFYHGGKTYKGPVHDIYVGELINNYISIDPIQLEMQVMCDSICPYELGACSKCVFNELEAYKKYREVAMLRFKANNYNNQTVYTPDGHKLGGEA